MNTQVLFNGLGVVFAILGFGMTFAAALQAADDPGWRRTLCIGVASAVLACIFFSIGTAS